MPSISLAQPGDQPIIPGDWDAGGEDEIGVYRPDPLRNSLTFTLDANGDGVFDAGDQVFDYGQPGDTVLSGKWQVPGQQLDAVGNEPDRRSSELPLTAATLEPVLAERLDRHLDGDKDSTHDRRNSSTTLPCR